jgi:hypothetical protein
VLYNHFPLFAYHVVLITQMFVDVLYPYSILVASILPPSRLEHARDVSFCTFGALETASFTPQSPRREVTNQANQAHQSSTLFLTIKPIKSRLTLKKKNTNQSKYRASNLIALPIENYVPTVLPSYTYTAEYAVTAYDYKSRARRLRIDYFRSPPPTTCCAPWDRVLG